ncbi:Mn2+-dependent serine/threonine protein kinase [Desulfurococcus amylolyticus 1221n]|uniref:Mn2+-dependent serine/threonine protein kinase n=1 Tax=Desulfurococcus amylolyticus (strain DSM 18924 / JCM 16383 / VKM B-2413 / 1221n) TaxID=490899 RepID=B8D4D8_DESA1|nr:serine/threonine protein kinase [Desulfurococcus amylolyticus]ACL10969.1 Mn2+-dependent serine/threonine protein kinase [Desulfurococcus amylolyticus 1221n]
MNINILEVLDSLSRQTSVIMVGSKKLVVKEYGREVGLIKWFMVNLSSFSIKMYPFVLNPRNRMEREVAFLKTSTPGFSKPSLYIVDYIGKRIIRGYVEGEKLTYTMPVEVYRLLGELLGRLHCSNWAIGDTKISNFIHSGGEIYIIDAEQAIETRNVEHFIWDLIVLISTLAISCYTNCILNQNTYLDRLQGFIKGYLGSTCIPMETLSNIMLSDDVKILLYLLIPFPLNTATVKTLNNMFSGRNILDE